MDDTGCLGADAADDLCVFIDIDIDIDDDDNDNDERLPMLPLLLLLMLLRGDEEFEDDILFYIV